MTLESTRIAAVRYLNTAPLIEGLDALAGLTLLPTVPSRIADMVLTGEADVGLVSMADALRHADRLTLLPVGMIGCDGATMTVRVFSSVPLDRVTCLHADTDSHTSVVLAQILLARLHGARPKVCDFDARERVSGGVPETRVSLGATDLDEHWPESVLLIGDKVVTDHPPEGRYPHQMDLGEAWKRYTGLPFAYAMWACRSEEAGSDKVENVTAILDRQVRHNLARLDWIVAARAPLARWETRLARRYLVELLRFRVDDRVREGVERFAREANELALIPGARVPWPIATGEPSLV